MRISAALLLLILSLTLLLPAYSSSGSQPRQPAASADDITEIQSEPGTSEAPRTELLSESDATASAAKSEAKPDQVVSRGSRLVASFTVFLLAIFVGFEVITKVPPTLHTPLMSGSNAISGITVIGALLAAGHSLGGFGSFLGMLATILAVINVVGGFLVTHRMLMMFKKR
jgi:H+-translocating NAD(P) transhydrogenase subunit alpha